MLLIFVDRTLQGILTVIVSLNDILIIFAKRHFNMISEITAQHEKWISIATTMCGNTDQAKDLVQDMYLKVLESPKQINQCYAYFIMRSVFIDGKRKKQPSLLDISTESILSDLSDDFNLDDIFTNEERFEAIEATITNLKWHEQVIVTESFTNGLRKFSRDSGIGIVHVSKIRNKFKELCLEKIQK